MIEALDFLPLAIRPTTTAEVAVLALGLLFALVAGAYAWREWQVDLRRLLWAGRLTRCIAAQGLGIYRQASREAVAQGLRSQEDIQRIADAAWEERPLLDAEIEARVALWLLSQPWHDGPDAERRFEEGIVFVTRREALRIVKSRRFLQQLFDEIRAQAGSPPRTLSTLRQLVPEVGGNIARGAW